MPPRTGLRSATISNVLMCRCRSIRMVRAMLSAEMQGRGILTAQMILSTSDDELIRKISELRASKQLYNSVHELNELLSTPQYRSLAEQALKKTGP